MGNVYTGSQIIELANMPSSHPLRETARNAHRSIVQRYGKIVMNAKYYHAGRGNWKDVNDKSVPKRKTEGRSKAVSKKLAITEVHTYKAVPSSKRKFDISKLKAVGGSKGRSKKTVPKVKMPKVVKHGINLKIGMKWTKNGRTYKIVGIDTRNGERFIKFINVDIPKKVHVDNEKWFYQLLMMGRVSIDQAERDAKAQKEIEEREREENRKQKEAESESIRGISDFVSGMTPMQRGKAIALLNKQKRYDGTVYKIKDHINMLVSHGYKVGKGEISNSRYVFNASKIETDYAKHLINKGIGKNFSISNLKSPTKPLPRKSKSAPEMSHKAVTKAVVKVPNIKIIYTRTVHGKNARVIEKHFTDPLTAFKFFISHDTNEAILDVKIPNQADALFTVRDLMGKDFKRNPSIAYNVFLRKTFLADYFATHDVNKDIKDTKKAGIRTNSIHGQYTGFT